MKTVIIRPGSIMIWKEHNIIKTLWYKFKKKSLPFNKFLLNVNKSIHIVAVDKEERLTDNKRYVIIEPRKLYSRAEQELLAEEVKNYEMFGLGIDSVLDIQALSNWVRPSTMTDDPFDITLEDVINNKYYRVIYDSTEKDY